MLVKAATMRPSLDLRAVRTGAFQYRGKMPRQGSTMLQSGFTQRPAAGPDLSWNWLV